MADVKIRKLPDSVVATFRLRAAAAGRSMEEELRLLLTEAASRSKQDMVAELDAFREMLRREYGTLSDSTEGIREDRESRG
jgi:plasmid stability protein